MSGLAGEYEAWSENGFRRSQDHIFGSAWSLSSSSCTSFAISSDTEEIEETIPPSIQSVHSDQDDLAYEITQNTPQLRHAETTAPFSSLGKANVPSVSDCRSLDIAAWSVLDVLSWLSARDCQLHFDTLDILKHHDVDGEVFLGLEEHPLKSELKIESYGQRYRLWKQIRSARELNRLHEQHVSTVNITTLEGACGQTDRKGTHVRYFVSSELLTPPNTAHLEDYPDTDLSDALHGSLGLPLDHLVPPRNVKQAYSRPSLTPIPLRLPPKHRGPNIDPPARECVDERNCGGRQAYQSARSRMSPPPLPAHVSNPRMLSGTIDTPRELTYEGRMDKMSRTITGSRWQESHCYLSGNRLTVQRTPASLDGETIYLDDYSVTFNDTGRYFPWFDRVILRSRPRLDLVPSRSKRPGFTSRCRHHPLPSHSFRISDPQARRAWLWAINTAKSGEEPRKIHIFSRPTAGDEASPQISSIFKEIRQLGRRLLETLHER